MKEKKLPFILTAIVVMGLFISLLISCASTGEYMPVSGDETVIGTVQGNFVLSSTSFITKSSRDKVSQQAYVILMEAAGKKYPGAIEVRDIVWVTGRDINNQYKEVTATGKVIRLNQQESAITEE
jgi:hypothetical protein